MQDEETMDLKHNNGVNGDDSYIPNSKSTDLIKPSKSGNLDNQQPSGECLNSNISKINICARKSFIKYLLVSSCELSRNY